MRTILVISIAAALCGCVTSKPVSLPNGVQGLAVNCPGAARDISDCMNRAAKECGGPYRILTRDGHVITAGAVPVGNNVLFASGIKRTLIVQCGP